ncbi:MAG: agmatinase [Thermoprotei archaeon]|nr:MAG: agmatinase [Thermoprotei archaeon]RLF18802.1 MAG: agmatinase [Thermoprotei archaeon]
MDSIIPPVIPFRGFNNEYYEARYVIIGFPFDGTTDYRPGSKLAPTYIRRISTIIEQISCFSSINIDSVKIHDLGDIRVYYDDIGKTMGSLRNAVKSVVEDNKIPVVIGGEHTAVLPILQSLKMKYSDLIVVAFDAHMDFFPEWPPGSRVTYATALRRAYDILGEKHLYIVGVRAFNEDELREIKQCQVDIVYRDELNERFDMILNRMKGRNVYVSIDVDVLDPSLACAVSHPEPGGLTYIELIDSIQKIIERGNVVGIDIVEYNPLLDLNEATGHVVTRLLCDVIGIHSRSAQD